MIIKKGDKICVVITDEQGNEKTDTGICSRIVYDGIQWTEFTMVSGKIHNPQMAQTRTYIATNVEIEKHV